jgi:hypothetical protein
MVINYYDVPNGPKIKIIKLLNCVCVTKFSHTFFGLLEKITWVGISSIHRAYRWCGRTKVGNCSL